MAKAPAPPVLYYDLEGEAGRSPSAAGFSFQESRVTRPYYYNFNQGKKNTATVAFASYTALTNIPTNILGSTKMAPSDGRLQRKLPKADSVFTYMYATAITGLKGVGRGVLSQAIPLQFQPPLIGPGFLYPAYEFNVEFRPRPYAVIADNAMPPMQSITWYDDDGAEKGSKYASEWLRYTDYQVLPKFNAVTCKQGQMRFRDTQAPADTPPGPKGLPFDGQPRLTLPDGFVEFTWSQIPYRYLTSAKSWLIKGLGHINQFDWYNWKKGQLLLVGFKINRYTPPVPEVTQYNGILFQDVPMGATMFSTDKLMDVTFQFLYTNRFTTTADFDPLLMGQNKNWVPSGHNLLPWLQDRKFHYATVVPNSETVGSLVKTKWQPSWPSIPYELLFTDPDIVGND